jgi:hypothetical protein
MKAIFYILALVALVGCQDSDYKNEIKIQKYFYKYTGFENNEKTMELLNEVKILHAQNDYIVTKNEQLIPWGRTEDISADTLHQLHQILHRLEPYDADANYKEGTYVIEIELLNSAKPKKPLFQFYRFTIGNNGEAKNELNFGEHEIALNKDSWIENAPYLAEKFAQVSFK